MIEKFIENFKSAMSGDLTKYRSVPFWSWNNELDEATLTNQIEEMKRVGIGGFIIHARTGLKTPYLGEKWFSCVDACLKKARALNMNVWIYDENGWPSGFVGGKLLENESFRARFLEYSVKDSFDDSAFCVYVKEKTGYRRVVAAEYGVEEYHCVYLRVSPSNTDILDPKVVSSFISETHEKYYERFKESFGRELVGFFTDEPQYYRWATPYPSTVKDEFLTEFGKDVTDGLIYLFTQDECGFEFRTQYYTVLNKLYTINYYKRLYDWCEAHGCKLTGHSVEEPHLYSQMWGGAGVMPCYEYEHIPAIDSLTRNGENFLSFKQVASVAAQLGKKFILTETFGCSGYDVTPTELRHIGEMQYFCGVNLMCQHLMPYSVAGQGKHDYPPVFSKQNNWWQEFAEFNEHFTGLGYLIANTFEQCDALVIHPMRSVYLNYIRETDEASVKEMEDKFNALLVDLNSRGITYHLADETLLEKYGSVENDKLKIGMCAYDKVIVPDMPSIASATLRLLEKFKGKLCVIGSPEYVDGKKCGVKLSSNVTIGDIEKLAAIDFHITDGTGIMTERVYNFGDLNGSVRFVFIKNLSLTDKMHCRLGGGKERFAAFDIDTLTFSEAKEEIELNRCESIILAEIGEGDLKFVRPTWERFAVNDITENFRMENISENYFVSDKAAFSFDGVNYSSEKPLPQIFENLLYERFTGKIYIKHTFFVTEKTPLTLMVEKYDFLFAMFNGVPVKFSPSGFDIKFAEADVSPYVCEGKNEYIYCIDYTQREDVRFAFFDPLATEALRNCLYYDTYIENVYVRGNFIVQKDGALARQKSLPHISSELFKEGYPFFYGQYTIVGNYEYNGVGKRFLLPQGRFVALNIRSGGKSKNLVYREQEDITELLKTGINKIEITVKSSLRNLLGPHHFRGFTETDWAGPDKFTLCRTWFDGVSPNYDSDYNLVPFGIDKLIIIETK